MKIITTDLELFLEPRMQQERSRAGIDEVWWVNGDTLASMAPIGIKNAELLHFGAQGPGDPGYTDLDFFHWRLMQWLDPHIYYEGEG